MTELYGLKKRPFFISEIPIPVFENRVLRGIFGPRRD
jgi:hypothetical protein